MRGLLSAPVPVATRFPDLAAGAAVRVTYVRRGNRCVLPATFAARRVDGLALVARNGSARVIPWDQLREVTLDG